jgi:hypothetical protein
MTIIGGRIPVGGWHKGLVGENTNKGVNGLSIIASTIQVPGTRYISIL